MKIQKVEIANFRSIKSLAFSPGDYTVLIGENNAGKSNILRAVNLVLGESWPTERAFSDEDFYNQDTSEPVSIKVYFDEIIEEWRNGVQAQIAGLELKCRAYKRKVKDKPAGSLVVDYHCIGADGEPITIPDRPLQKGQQYKGAWLPMRVTNELRDNLPFIYVDVTREYDKHSPGGRWSVLRRLFDDVNKEFAADAKKIQVVQADGTTIEMTRREAFEQAVKNAYGYLRTPLFDTIENRLAANALEQMGLDTEEGEVALHFQAHDPSNAYKSLQLFINQLGIESPATEVGSGLQSAVVVAIFRTYAELKKAGAIFAIEEPEVYLHPQKARFFKSVLLKLAESGNQVFVTTHSPVFVDISKPESVALVRRINSEGTKVLQPESVELAPDDRSQLRLLTEFDSQRSELFFARKIVLVEGVCEKLIVPMVFGALGVDINRQGISVIECGGKTKIKLFARVANALKIPYMAIIDHDIREIDEDWSDKRKQDELRRNSEHNRWNSEIEAIVPNGQLFYLVPNLEGVSGLPLSNESAKVDNAIAFYEGIVDKDIPESIITPLCALIEM